MRAGHLWGGIIGGLWSLLFSPVAGAGGPSGPVSLCTRSPPVREALLKASCPQCSCQQVTREQLASVRELALNKRGLKKLKPGDLAGLGSLEKLDLSDNPLKILPNNLATQLGALKSLKLDLSLFTRLPEAVVKPLLDRPGFAWELPYPVEGCRPYEEPLSSRPIPSLAEVEEVLQLPPPHQEITIRPWTPERYLVGFQRGGSGLELFVLARGKDQGLVVVARTQHAIDTSADASTVFDLAPYRLTPSELGFGLRRIRDKLSAMSAQRAEEEELQVFRVRDGWIERVLKTVVYTDAAQAGPPAALAVLGEDKAPADTDWEEHSCSIIAVLNSKSHGVFDWVKVYWGSSTRSDDGGAGANFPAAVFRWTGERYESQIELTTPLLFKDN